MAFELSVELTGKIDGLRDNFNAAIREVGKLDKDTRAKLASVDKGFADLANKIDQSIGKKAVQSTARGSNEVSKNLAKIAASADNMGGKVAVGSNRAGMALTDLGRIAQDAPYGFIGIQNNLNPLLESFGRLKAETGSVGGALKALGSSLIGPAGLGIAISVISSAILFYNQYQAKAAKETANSESAMKKAKKTAEEYALSLDEVTRANLIGSQNAARELVDLKLLYDTTQNITLSTKLRAQAVDTLQEKYPSYFKNIKDENILNGSSIAVYNALTTAILASSRARAAGDIMAENDKRNFTNIQKRNDLEVQYGNTLSKQAILQKALADPKQAASAQFNARELANLEEQRADIASQIRGFKRDEEILNGRNLKLSAAILDYQKQGAEIDGKVGGSESSPAAKRVKDVKTLSDVLAELEVSLIQVDNTLGLTFGDKSKDKIKAYQKSIDDLIKMGYDPATEAIKRLKEAQQGLMILPDAPSLPLPKGDPLKVKGQTKDFYNLNAITDEQAKIIQSQIKFNEQFNGLVSNGLSDGIAGLANAFGEVLANGGNAFEALGASLLGSLGGVLTQLGEMAIGVGVGLVAIKKALQSLNPVVAIAAGVALVALGGYVSAKASSIGGGIKGGNSGREATAFANGGIISGPTLGLMGEYAGAKNNPEVVAPLSKLSQIIGGSKELSSAIAGNVNKYISSNSNSNELVNNKAGNVFSNQSNITDLGSLLSNTDILNKTFNNAISKSVDTKLGDMIGATSMLSEVINKSVINSFKSVGNTVGINSIQKVRGERQETAIFIADSKIIGEDIHTSFRRVDKRLGRV